MNNDKISVSLDLDTSYYDKEISKAQEKIDKFGKQLENPFKLDIDLGSELLSGVINEVNSEMEKIASEIDKIQSRISDKQSKLADAAAKYSEASAKWGKDWADKYFSTDQLEQSINVDSTQLDEAYNKMQTLQDALTTISQHKIGDIIDLGDALPQSQELINNFNGLWDYKELGKKIGDGILKGLSKVPGIIKSCVSGFNTMRNKVKDIVKQFNPLGKIIANIGSSIKRQMVTMIASALNPLNNFKKAFSYLTDVLSPRLGATFKNIGNNLTEYIANSPAFKALINDLLYFIKLLETAFNKLASFLNLAKLDLFKTSAKSAKEMEKSTKGAASAAKSLAGFDEINNIANTGGGAGSSDTTPMSSSELFSGKDIDLSIFDYINDKIYKLHDTLESIDFYSVGSHIADGISSFVTKIDWGTLTNSVSIGVQGILKTLTGLFDNLDLEGIGKTITDVFANLDLAGIAEAFSTAIISAYEAMMTLLSEVDWSVLGTQIADFFLNFDWWGVLVAWVQLIGTLLISCTELIWSFVSTLLTGIWNKFYKWFSSTPFGQTVVQVFSDAWSMIKDIWDVAAPYFEATFEVIKAVAETCWEEIKIIFSTAWDIIKAVWDVVVGYFKMIWENIKAIFSVVKSILSGDFEGAWNGIKKIWDNVKSYFQTIWNSIKSIFGSVASFFTTTFSNAVDGIKKAFTPLVTFANLLKEGFKSILNGIITFVEGFCNKVVSGINKLIKSINKIKFDVPDWVPVIGGKTWGFGLSELKEVAIPRLNTGTNYVPQDTYAYIHQGEAVIPKEFNEREFFGNDETNELLLQVIDAINDIEINPYTTVRDVGKTAIDYINTQKRVLGRSVV